MKFAQLKYEYIDKVCTITMCVQYIYKVCTITMRVCLLSIYNENVSTSVKYAQLECENINKLCTIRM